MTVALEIAQLFQFHRSKPPVRKPPQVQAIIRIADRVNKVFSPHENEINQDFNPEQFHRDAFGTEKVLAYDDRTIHTKYKAEFNEIQDLSEAQNQVIIAQRSNDSAENQALYDGLEDQITEKTADLKAKIKTDFGNFLTTHLGPKRLHLIPEISYRFSRKAMTTFIAEVNNHTTKKYGGFFTDGHSQESCTLIIPEDPTGAVQIDASTRGLFQSFIAANNPEKVVRPVELIGHAVYTIGLDGKTEADLDFVLSDF
jgi:hypothetical protein